MLKENQIEIPEETLKKLFAIVNPKHPMELTLDEFIKFSFDLKANKRKFFLEFIIKKYRVQKSS